MECVRDKIIASQTKICKEIVFSNWFSTLIERNIWPKVAGLTINEYVFEFSQMPVH